MKTKPNITLKHSEVPTFEINEDIDKTDETDHNAVFYAITMIRCGFCKL